MIVLDVRGIYNIHISMSFVTEVHLCYSSLWWGLMADWTSGVLQEDSIALHTDTMDPTQTQITEGTCVCFDREDNTMSHFSYYFYMSLSTKGGNLLQRSFDLFW